jgi:hypothetical protein
MVFMKYFGLCFTSEGGDGAFPFYLL